MPKLNPALKVLSLSVKKKGVTPPHCSGISFCAWKVPLCGLFYNMAFQNVFRPSLDPLKDEGQGRLYFS